MDFDTEHVTLGKLIAHLKSLPSALVVAEGFGKPHSYRGYYDNLAFEPVRDTTVGAMLAAANAALGTTYTGYKGGEFTMEEYTPCWVASYGDCGKPVVFSARAAVFELPA